MPITKQAIKKLRHDRALTTQNAVVRRKLKSVIKKARTAPSEKTVSEAYSSIDKAIKHHLIHKNTAGRIKSRLSTLLKK